MTTAALSTPSIDGILDPQPDGTPLGAACFPFYRARGFALCRIPIGLKKPVEPLWQLNPILEAEEFQVGDAIGLILGPLSSGLFAIDLDFHADDADAWAAADVLLPATGLVDGRPGKLTSHRVYRLADTAWADSVLPKPGCATRQAMDDGFLPRFPGTRHFSNGQGRAIDALGAGSQLVIPPSLHPSGVRRVWWADMPGEPASVAYADLMAAVAALVDHLGLHRQRAATPEDALEPPDPAGLARVAEPERIRRLQSYLASATPLEHDRHQGFHAQQWRIACVCAELGVPREAAEPLYLAWNRASATPDDDTRNATTLANAYRSAVFGARLIEPDLPGLINPGTAPTSGAVGATGTSVGPGPRRLAFQWFSDTPERKPLWLWQGYLLHGATAVVGGRQGTSKGLFTIDIAARLTRGEPMPDGSGGGTPTKVLIVTREDDPEMSLVPRLRLAGADMSQIAWSRGDFTDQTPIATMAAAAEHIANLVREHWFGCVIIDPLGAWVEDDANNGQQIRAVIDPMNRVAADTGCAVLFVAHLRKAQADDPMDAFAGSVQVTAACRTAILITPTMDGSERLVRVVKTNFRRPETALLYRLDCPSTDPDDPPVLVWRQATSEDLAVAVTTASGSAPIVPLASVLELLPNEHRPIKDAARMIRKSLLPVHRGVTVRAVLDALVEAIAAGSAHEGYDRHGARTVGMRPAVPAESVTDRAAAYWIEHPESSVRQVAQAVGCSTSLACKARQQMAPFTVHPATITPGEQ
jgi:hypothetical protein